MKQGGQLKNLAIGMLHKTGDLDFYFKEKEILDAVKRHENNQSKSGPISNEMLKCSPKATVKTLCSLFNHILKSKTFPEIWNLSLINPIHKSGTTTLHEHDRGISISTHPQDFSRLCFVLDSNYGFLKRVYYLTNHYGLERV